MIHDTWHRVFFSTKSRLIQMNRLVELEFSSVDSVLSYLVDHTTECCSQVTRLWPEVVMLSSFWHFDIKVAVPNPTSFALGSFHWLMFLTGKIGYVFSSYEVGTIMQTLTVETVRRVLEIEQYVFSVLVEYVGRMLSKTWKYWILEFSFLRSPWIWID